jgi:hypothetical protein
MQVSWVVHILEHVYILLKQACLGRALQVPEQSFVF